MFTPPRDLTDADVAEALERGWGLAVDEIAYLPVGFGSHHWRADSKGTKWFITVDDLETKRRSEADSLEAAALRLAAAMQTAHSLHGYGLDFVAAPLISRQGRALESIDGRFVISLFDHLEGETSSFGPYPTRAARMAVLERLTTLHRLPPSSMPALDEDFEIPRREIVATAPSVGTDGALGPYTKDAKKLLTRHRDSLESAFARFDQLVTVASERRSGWVVTHGEPHRANTIDTADRGVVLIDWDTVRVAPPERDLWALIGEDAAIAREYTEVTSRKVDHAVVDLYTLLWDLTEVCLYAAEFLAPHERTADIEVAWESFERYLDPSRWTTAR